MHVTQSPRFAIFVSRTLGPLDHIQVLKRSLAYGIQIGGTCKAVEGRNDFHRS